MLSLPSRPVVAVALGQVTESTLELVDGIREVGRSGGRNWELILLSGGYEAALRRLAASGTLHGAIGDFVSDAWLGEWQDGRVCVVQTAEISVLERTVNVTAPYREIGRRAAEVLRSEGATTFGFLGPLGQFAAMELEAGFRAELAATGKPISVARAFISPVLREFLRPLAGSVGLLAASDRWARLAVEAARALGRRCPEEIAVIGVGDQRIESLHAGMGLSSFELPAREIGRRAAQWLAESMAGREVPAGVHPVGGTPLLHERASSLRRGGGLERAVAYARSHLGESLPVEALARRAGMSRRSFETAFQRNLGSSPAEWLRSRRRERAEHLLATTALDVQEIGRRCGYAEPAVFSAAFKQWTGLAPRSFRQKARRRRAETEASFLPSEW